MSWIGGLTTRLLQVLAACLTAVVFLLRRQCVLARCRPLIKCSSNGINPPIVRDSRSSRGALASLAEASERRSLGSSAPLRGPRCKQDPIINDFTEPPLV